MQRGLFLFLCGLLGALAAGAPGAVYAQEVQVRVEQAPLEEAIEQVRRQSGIDVVYAQRQVERRTSTCAYSGPDGVAALACVLNGTGLQAERVRRKQYVLVARPDGAAEAADSLAVPPPRITLAGYVAGAETGELLPGAHVYLIDVKVGTVTNQGGYFALPELPVGVTYDVRVSYLGYRSLDTTLTVGADPVRFMLRPATIESEGVIVESDADRGVERTRMPGMMALSQEQIEQLPSLGEPDLFKALQWTPGIRKSGVVSGGLSVRGGQPDQNLYLLDGAPVYHPWHAFSLISTFQPGTLKYTSLYRGAFPAEHGGRLSAILDAQMKDGSRTEPEAVVGVSVLSTRFRIESPVTERTSFMLSGRRSYIDKLVGRTHPVEDASGRRDTLRTGYYFYDVSGKIAHRFDEQNRVSLTYYQGRDDLDLRLPFDLSLDFSSWLRPADLFFEVQQAWENRLVSGQHQYVASDRVFVTTTAYYSGYDAREASLVQPSATASLESDYDVRLRDIGLKVDADYYHSVAHQLRAGIRIVSHRFQSALDTELQRSTNAVDRESQVSRLEAAEVVGYVQDIWKPSPRWTVQPGLRASWFSGGRYLHVRPRLSARYIAHPDYLVVRGGVGAQVQYLHRLRDRYSLAYDLVSSRWVPSSSRVKPSSNIQVGLGALSQPMPQVTLEVSTYARASENILVPRDASRTKDDLLGPGIEVGALLGQYTPAKERAIGIETTAYAEQGPWMFRFGWATGRTIVRAPDLEYDEWHPSDLDVPYSLQGAVSWSNRAWEFTLAAENRSGYPLTAPVARYRIGDPVDDPETYLYRPQINNGRLPTYFRLDASIGYAFGWLDADWKAKLNVFNLTNRANVVSRRHVPVEDGVQVRDRRGLPILPLIEIEMKL